MARPSRRRAAERPYLRLVWPERPATEEPVSESRRRLEATISAVCAYWRWLESKAASYKALVGG